MTEERRKKEGWRMGKIVSPSTIIVVVVQIVLSVMWASELNARVKDIDRRVTIGEEFDREYSKANSEACQRLARVEEKITSLLSGQIRIEGIIEKRLGK